MKRMKSWIFSALFVSFIVLNMAPASYAVLSIDPQISISWQDATGAGGQWATSFGSDHELRLNTSDKSAAIGNIVVDPAVFSQYLAEQTGLAGSGLTFFNMVYNVDPYVAAGFSFTNNSAVTQTYTVQFISPVNPAITPSSLYGGSMSGSFTADPTGATVTTAPNTPLFWGMIDGAGVLPIHNDFASWSVAGGGSNNIPAVNILPSVLVGPAVNNDISIQFKFTLTPGDTATMNGYFEVIPEPATLLLLGLGGFLVRRKK